MPHRILVVSDSTDSTADHVVQAALVQFKKGSVAVERRAETRTLEQIIAIVAEAHESGSMLVHAMASPDLRREIYRRANEKGIPSVDLLGNLLSDLSTYLRTPSRGVPGGFHPFDENDYRRMEALTFVVKHDDGLGLNDLDRAEIILVGISRTSKTPLSMYLAVRGHFVANVPIAFGIEPPPRLFKTDQRKIVALRMESTRLNHIRQQRLKQWEDARKHYIDAKQVQQEVQWADEIFASASWPVVDVSLKSLEEVAVEVVSLSTNLRYRSETKGVGG